MSSKYLNSVNRLMRLRGNEDLSLRSITSLGVDINNPSEGPTTTTADTSIYSYKGKYKASEIDGTLIKKEDIKLYVDPTNLSVEPSTSDVIVDGPIIWSIKSLDKWKDQDTVVLYVFQLRE